MASKKMLDDLKNTVSNAQASLHAQAHGRKIAAKKRARDGRMPKQKPQPKKRTAKNPTDPNLLARSVIEAAIGESLTPRKKHKATKSARLKK